MGATRGGAVAPSGNVVKGFVHCRTLNRRIIYALFLQHVVGYWGLRSRTPTEAPSMDPARPQTWAKPLI